jgi:hypothetical protein
VATFFGIDFEHYRDTEVIDPFCGILKIRQSSTTQLLQLENNNNNNNNNNGSNKNTTAVEQENKKISNNNSNNDNNTNNKNNNNNINNNNNTEEVVIFSDGDVSLTSKSIEFDVEVEVEDRRVVHRKTSKFFLKTVQDATISSKWWKEGF